MTPAEARNLIPGDTVEYATKDDELDTGYVKEVRSAHGGVMALVRSDSGWGNELIPARRLIARTACAIRKPIPSIKACRDMTRGYIT